MSILDGLRDLFSQWVTPVRILRGPMIASGLAALVLSQPEQTLEIYRSLAFGSGDERTIQLTLAIVTLLLTCLLIWYLGRNLTLRWQQDKVQLDTVEARLLRWLPRILGALPLVGLGLGLHSARDNLFKPDSQGHFGNHLPTDVAVFFENAKQGFAFHDRAFIYGAVACFLAALVFVLATYWRSRNKRVKYASPNPLIFSPTTRIFFLVMAIALVVLFSAFFFEGAGRLNRLAEQIGTIAIFNLFIICLAFFLSSLTNIYLRTLFPALSILLIVAVVATTFDLNDNHGIRVQDDYTKRQQSLRQSFVNWLESRPDREYYRRLNVDYPVYIVVAQGGGLYAANQAAITLARIQDRCPAFAQHIFLINGVSGGAMGSALFSALVDRHLPKEGVSEPICKTGLQKKGPLETRADEFLNRDFLTPVVAAGLFPDFLQRFIPVPIKRFDRARAFEASLERAWEVANPEFKPGENPFVQSYYKLWKVDGITPALILNTVEVETGRRRLFSPFRFKRTNTALPTMHELVPKHIALSTAVGISARFPWVLPAATWREGLSRQYRFTDGGMFEYSGATTALDIAELLKAHLKFAQTLKETDWDPKAKIRLIMLTDDEAIEEYSLPALDRPELPAVQKTSDRRYVKSEESQSRAKTRSFKKIPTRDDKRLLDISDREAEKHRRRGFGEILSPVRAALNVRAGQGARAVKRAFISFCTGCTRQRRQLRAKAGRFPAFDGLAPLFRLNFNSYSLPLGWQLSSQTRKIISAHSGYADKCLATVAGIRDTFPWSVLVFSENNCSACRIQHDLAGTWLSVIGGLRREIKLSKRRFIRLCQGDDLARLKPAPDPAAAATEAPATE